ncbi:ubiquitin-conjugating enzyme E2 S isoform X1 [Zonotrichia leucophrys gambelii]|uniref:ubiquitin-conjugating enzyme E2 S isoform X1 n=1 Tax=Zonotrichia leucophrys gambelii TaxID=257770 RepID=UPI00314096A3
MHLNVTDLQVAIERPGTAPQNSPQNIPNVPQQYPKCTPKIFLCNLGTSGDVTDLQVAIEGPEGTPYAGGLFRMKLVLGKDFPAAPPKGFFLTKIFHPNVGPSGEICVNVLKRDWRAELGLRHVLLTIKCLLIQPNPESALNEEAARLLLEDFERFAARARLLTDIHARGPPPAAPSPPRGDPPAPGPSGAAPAPPDGPVPKKHAGDRKAPPKKKTGDKKRALRRL